jgi:hypothetical protein
MTAGMPRGPLCVYAARLCSGGSATSSAISWILRATCACDDSSMFTASTHNLTH